MAAVCTGSSLVVALPPVAHAQDAAVSRRAAVLEQVLVTAQRREQVQQEVPISIQVVGTDLLDDVAADDLGDLTVFVPGLDVASESPTQPRYSIRGIRSNDFGVGTDPSVGVYVDGVYAARSGASLLAFNDVERIEVLKGPQGTLFGRNATGGAILLETRDPTFDPSFEVQGTVARYNDYLLNAYGSTGLTESIAVDAAFIYRQGDGFIENIATGADDDGQFDRHAYRVSALYQGEDGLKVRLAFAGSSADEPLYSALAAWGGNSKALQVGPLIGVTPIIGSDNLEVSNTAPTAYTTDSNGGYLTIEKDFGDVLLKSLTMYRSSDSRTLIDLDSSDLPIFAVRFEPSSTTFSQEFDLTGTVGDLEWVAGAYYMQYDNEFRPLAATEAFGMQPFTIYEETSTSDQAYAVFADVTYMATDNLFLTAGARYSYEDISARVRGLSTPVGPMDMPEWSHDWSNVSPRVVVRYQLDGEANVYASYSQGYKAGMLQPSSFTTVPIDRLNASRELKTVVHLADPAVPEGAPLVVNCPPGARAWSSR